MKKEALKEVVDKNTSWVVTSKENYGMAKVLEWLLNNGGGYNYWHDSGEGDWMSHGDTRDLELYCKEHGLNEMETIYYLWLLNRNNAITLYGFGGDKGTEFKFYVVLDCFDGQFLDINIIEMH